MPRRTLNDRDLRADLDEGLGPAEIAQKRNVSDRTVSRRILRLGALNDGAAVKVADEIMAAGINQARAYYMIQMTMLEQLDDLAEDAEHYREAKEEALGLASEFLARFDEDENIFTPSFEKTMDRLTSVPDPYPNMFKAAQLASANMALYVDIYKTLTDLRAMATLKQALLELLELGDPRIVAIIGAYQVRAESARSLLGMDRHNPDPDPTTWSQAAEQSFQSLPRPETMPDPKKIIARHGVVLDGKAKAR